MTLVTDMKQKILLAFLFTIFVLLSYGQNRDSVRYTVGFRFVPGLYLSFEDFKQNKPIESAQIVSPYDIEDINFFTKLLKEEKITFKINQNEVKSVGWNEVWGYSNGISVYFLIFYSPNEEGKLITDSLAYNYQKQEDKAGHTSRYKTWNSKNSPYQIRLASIGRVCFYSYNVVSTGNYRRNKEVSITDGILLWESGKDMSVKNGTVKSILQKDPDLYNEYIKKVKPTKKVMKMFLIKYNQRNPIYFPVR